MAKQFTESRRQGIDPLCIGIVKRSSASAVHRTELTSFGMALQINAKM